MARRERERVHAAVRPADHSRVVDAELREHGVEVVGRVGEGRHDVGGVGRRGAVAGPVDGEEPHPGGCRGLRIGIQDA